MKINRQKMVDVFLYAVRIAIGCMFIYSSLPKIRQPYDFLASIYSYELAGPKLGMFVAMTLPWLELIVGVCLIGGIFTAGALLAGIAMSAMFSYVLGAALAKGLEITCGCFGAGATELITYKTFIRAMVILTACGLAYIIQIVFAAEAAKKTSV
ncbi:MAG: hypothetical protein A2Y13_05445 [Planctomycetes bacterium GWC2_45_44]|nr:MAG: hypothetical protein A2Y13_05445 [Planctomycetes bacterium GWC2_45_44]